MILELQDAIGNTHQAFIDDEDYNKIKHFKWKPLIRPNGCYVVANYQGKKFLLHRFLMDVVHGDKRNVDHEDHNPLNNQKSNLRVCTPRENNANLRKNSANTSGYKGVCWSKDHKKWEARIRLEKGRKFIGRFDDKIQAALAYDFAAESAFGEFAATNKKMGLL